MGRQTIIGIPGYWETPADVFASIADKSDGFLLLPRVNLLVEESTGNHYALEIYEFDPNLANAFAIAGRTWITQNDIDAISSHKLTLYALSKDVSIEMARCMLEVGCALLRAGGIAVKVESTGIAHSATKWVEFAQSDDLYQLYCAYVVLIKGSEYYYSCGMHNFGLPEASTALSLGPEAAAELMNEFNFYLLSKNPAMQGGETFRVAANTPPYRVERAVCELYAAEDPFHNPFGRWHLIPIAYP